MILYNFLTFCVCYNKKNNNNLYNIDLNNKFSNKNILNNIGGDII